MASRSSYGLILGIMLAPLVASASANGTEALFNLDVPSGAPFPSDRFTVRDQNQNTGLRVNLPKPDCVVRASDCEDMEVLNELDGFNLQPRISIPFSGPIDVESVSSQNVFLMPLGGGLPIGINQIVWDVGTNTLHVESDELLAQHSGYLLLVMRSVRDAAGDPLEASGAFQAFRHGGKVGHRDDDVGITTYRESLRVGLERAAAAGIDLNKVAVASVFTTQSITAVLEKTRAQIKATPAAADFVLGGPMRTIRTVFALGDITSISGRGEVRTAPPADFTNLAIRIALIRTVPETVGTVAFGSYRSPVYLNAGRFIPQVGTRTGVPVIQGVDEVFFSLFLPAATTTRPRPATGWPVAIYGPGCCADDNKNGTPFNIAATLAEQGVATIAINAAGQGLGPRSSLTVVAAGQTVTFPAGGRSIDLNGDGAIGAGEGTDTPRPRRILFNRDPRLQTIADLMQLVRVIEAGVDADGDGQADLDPSRIYYVGHSAGAVRGVTFAAVEPGIRAAVLSVPGGALSERIRLSPGGGNRVELGELLAERVPPLINSPGVVNLEGIAVGAPHFNENVPLRNGIALSVQLTDNTSQVVQSPVVNTVAGATDIQQMLEHLEWANMPADPAAFAPYLRKIPLDGRSGTPVIVQVAKGDQTVPNPSTAAILRAGDLADRTTYYRTDIAIDSFGAGPPAPPPTPPPGVEKSGHVFLVRMNSPLRTAIAVAAQRQVAVFLASDGLLTIDPNEILAVSPPPLGPLFETPIQGPLPEDLNFIP